MKTTKLVLGLRVQTRERPALSMKQRVVRQLGVARGPAPGTGAAT